MTAFINRKYLRMSEISERWNVSQDDVWDCALAGSLELSVLVHEIHVLVGKYKTGSNGAQFQVHTDRKTICGFQALKKQGIVDLLSHVAKAQVRSFKPSNDDHYLELAPSEKELIFNPDAVLITQDEYLKFEEKHNIAPLNAKDDPTDFYYENDFRD